jgi:oxygen-independent coproporphyrinogen-3 oxidase
VREGLGGSHTVVTYPPLDVLEPVQATTVASRVAAVGRLNLYCHIAFCEFLCPFCHYDTAFTKLGAAETPRMQAYLRALLAEAEMWRGTLEGSTLASLYIGGGTPTAVGEKHLLALLEAACLYARTDDFVACIETSPLTTVAPGGPEKLRVLSKSGVNRISVGVQSFDEQLLQRSRGHGLETVLQALDTVMGLVDEVNIDLIQDLPGQTDEHLLTDLTYVEVFRPAQVTWYVLRFRGESAWSRFYQRGALDLPSALESARRRAMIAEGMSRLGYLSRPGGRFVREPRFRDRFKSVRSELTSALLGVGVSAYSHGWDLMFRNTRTRDQYDGIRGYTERIATGRFAVDEAFEIDKTEREAGAIVAGIRDGLTRLPFSATPDADISDYQVYATDVFARLVAAGLVEQSGESLCLSSLGRLFEEEVCSMLYSRRVAHKLRLMDAYWGGASVLSGRIQDRLNG